MLRYNISRGFERRRIRNSIKIKNYNNRRILINFIDREMDYKWDEVTNSIRRAQDNKYTNMKYGD